MSEPDRSTRRRDVEQRAKGCCEYCQSPAKYSTQTFALEHIIPRSQGGDTSLANLALACQGCNNHKYNKTKSRDPVGMSRSETTWRQCHHTRVLPW